MKLKSIILWVFAAGLLAGCVKDLDRSPLYSTTADNIYSSVAGYKNVLAKVYGGLALTGNQGPAGNGDVKGIDEGFSDYLRAYFNLQELPTDEAVVGWNDQTIKDYHDMDWSASDAFNRSLYSRIFYQITLANSFISEASDENLAKRGLAGKDADEIRKFRAEVRFLRAMSYWHALDLFGNPSFVTDLDKVGSAFLPKQIMRAELFTYVESECKALEGLLMEPKTNEYARIDKGALWMLMANLYLNANIYTGTAKYTEAVTYSAKVLGAGYSLQPKYGDLFLADNHTSPEIIYHVAFDGIRTKSFGGTTFLTHAGVGGSMDLKLLGVNGGWGGYRTTSALVNKFPDATGVADKRSMFHTAGQNLEIADISLFTEGYAVTKWRNVQSTGGPGSSLDHADVDFPIFRLAEAHLIFAEAVLRGGAGGTTAQALTHVNALRQRAYGNNSGNFTTLTLDDILDERARELYWEGKRRTDLVRFGKFTTNAYIWPWKGGVSSGTAVASFRNIYPIPSPEINSNPNLVQNPGY